jgi:tetratricopeptide (TPR) repeat protein
MKVNIMSLGRWIGVAGLIFALNGSGIRHAVSQELVSRDDRGGQQTAPANSAGGDIAVTPLMAADMLLARQQYNRAIEAFEKIEPRTAYIYNKIGIAYQHLAVDDEAGSSFREAMLMEDEAKFNYRRAIKLDRRYAPAYNNLGTIYFHEKDNHSAERMYRRAIKLNGKSASFWSNLAATYLARQEFRASAEAYQRAFSLNPNIFEQIALEGIQQQASPQDLAAMYLCFAEIYAQAGMKLQAVDYLRKALLLGLENRQKLQQDVQLASLRGTPEFQSLFPVQQR